MAINKHMDLHDRIVIEKELMNHGSFKSIARILGKDCTTISKEVRKNSPEKKICSRGRTFNNCIHRNDCERSGVCQTCTNDRLRLCRSCICCRDECEKFVEEICPSLSKPPYVCNGCRRFQKCRLMKKIYHAQQADSQYRKRLVDSRRGFNVDEDDISRLNAILTPLISDHKQSIHHVYINHADELMMSERSLYKLIDQGVLEVRNIDLPRQVRFRRRKHISRDYKVDKHCLEGRRYEDFLAFMKEHADLPIAEMDTVEGKRGTGCLLTLHLTNCSFMIAYKREFNDSRSVTDIFNQLYESLGREVFMKLFPVILTDNGSEFSNPRAIEFDNDGRRRTYVFYCHPSSPFEKGSCEVNHELIRKFIPKGESMESRTQKDISLMMSHIDSYARAKLNDKCPVALFSILYSEEVMSKLSISRIAPDAIKLTSDIFR